MGRRSRRVGPAAPLPATTPDNHTPSSTPTKTSTGRIRGAGRAGGTAMHRRNKALLSGQGLPPPPPQHRRGLAASRRPRAASRAPQRHHTLQDDRRLLSRAASKSSTSLPIASALVDAEPSTSTRRQRRWRLSRILGYLSFQLILYMIAQVVLWAALTLYLTEAADWRPQPATLFALKTVLLSDPDLSQGPMFSDLSTGIFLLLSLLSFAFTVWMGGVLLKHAAVAAIQYHKEARDQRLRQVFHVEAPVGVKSTGFLSKPLLGVSSGPFAFFFRPNFFLLLAAFFVICIVGISLALISLDADLTFVTALSWCFSSALSTPTAAHIADPVAQAYGSAFAIVLSLLAWALLLWVLLWFMASKVATLSVPSSFKVISELEARLDRETELSSNDLTALVLQASGHISPATLAIIERVYGLTLERLESARRRRENPMSGQQATDLHDQRMVNGMAIAINSSQRASLADMPSFEVTWEAIQHDITARKQLATTQDRFSKESSQPSRPAKKAANPPRPDAVAITVDVSTNGSRPPKGMSIAEGTSDVEGNLQHTPRPALVKSNGVENEVGAEEEEEEENESTSEHESGTSSDESSSSSGGEEDDEERDARVGAREQQQMVDNENLVASNDRRLSTSTIMFTEDPHFLSDQAVVGDIAETTSV